MNKSTRIIFLLVALAAAALVSYTVYKKTTVQTSVAPVEEQKTLTQIAVASRPLERGAKIVAEDLRLVPYLKDSLPAGHFTETGKAEGRIVLQPILPTEPVLESALAPTDLAKGGIAAIITPKKRGMAVKVDDVIGVAGFVQPGHLVDVIVTIETPGEQKSQISKTVLENIPVLAIGSQTDESAEKDKAAKVTRKITVVTLEVDLEEGEKLALAVNEGRIQLALRGYTDSDQILTKGVNVPALLKSYATASPAPVTVVREKDAPPPKPPVVKPPFVIEVMNGNKVAKIAMKTQ
jgi:pilus assembly protein CpaB